MQTELSTASIENSGQHFNLLQTRTSELNAQSSLRAPTAKSIKPETSSSTEPKPKTGEEQRVRPAS